jgi:DNA-binding transcriptional LysR family regulator
MLTLGPLVAPKLCQNFMSRHPDVSINLVEGDPEQLMSGLGSGQLAMAITYDLDPGHDDLEFEGLMELPPYAVFAEDDELAGRDTVALSELAGKNLVLLDLPLSRQYFFDLFDAEGLKPTIGYRSPRPETIRALVANGFGYTLVNARPQLDYALDGGRLVSLPITGHPRARTLGIATVKDVKLSRTATAFREHCRARISPDGVPGLRVDVPGINPTC